MLENIDPLIVSAAVLGGGLLLKVVQSFKSVKEFRLVIKKNEETTLVLKREERISTSSHTKERVRQRRSASKT